MSNQIKKSSISASTIVGCVIIALAAVGIVIGILFLAGVLGSPAPAAETQAPQSSTVTAYQQTETIFDEDGKKFTYTETAEVSEYVKIYVENYGTIVIKLDPTQAPITVANFQKLVGEQFYDGLIFHRVIPNFMIQGGDPNGTGTGGSSETIKGEFSNNGVTNTIEHTRGVISMARNMSSNDSASSQFFIVQTDYPSLNGDYAAFGHVISGMDVVDAIVAVPRNSNNKPLTDVVMKNITFVTVTYAT